MKGFFIKYLNRKSFLISLYVTGVFLLFRWININESRHISSSVKGLLRNEYKQANTYLISKTLSDLENLGIIKCAVLHEHGQVERKYYDTSSHKGCFKKLFVKNVNFTALNGLEYSLRFEKPRNWHSILLEILIYLSGITFILLYLLKIEKDQKKSVFRLKILELEHNLMEEKTSQVRHDIASPIASLKSIINSIKLEDIERKILNMAFHRIEDIFNDLNSTKKLGHKICNIKKAIEEIVIEKEVLKLEGVTILSNINNVDIFCDEAEFKRVISNLLNNSIEAKLKNTALSLKIETLEKEDFLEIQIHDNGKGIPKAILSTLGKRGVSYGKEDIEKSGNGLGLYHAKKVINEMGGDLIISSILNKGTSIYIKIPYLKNKHKCTADAVLLDDDEMIIRIWKLSAKKNKINLKTFSHKEDLLSKIGEFSKDINFYIDSNLSNNTKGEDVAKKLYHLGYENIFLVTGFAPSKFENLNFLKGVLDKSAPW